MSGTVYSSKELPVAVIVHPVKVATHNIFWKEEHKCIFEGIFSGKHSSLNTFRISDTCSYIFVLLFNLHTLLNNLCSPLFNFFFKNYLFLYQVFFLSLIHISEPTRLGMISYAVFCL